MSRQYQFHRPKRRQTEEPKHLDVLVFVTVGLSLFFIHIDKPDYMAVTLFAAVAWLLWKVIQGWLK